MRLEEIKQGLRINGVVPGEAVTVVGVQQYGPDTVNLIYQHVGGLGQQLIFRKREEELVVAQAGSRPFDAPAQDFKLAAEAQRIKLAGLFDPMLAVATSDVRPLPHQIRAVYGDLLPRTPLRFLLADDPGAGKTIMAGLYIKELILRGDVRRCLIVAPGGLVEQWQDELRFKFGLEFQILTKDLIEAQVNLNAFDNHPYLIARMDQLSRSDPIKEQLKESEWDLVVVDEAHRMSAHYYGMEVSKTKRFQLGELLGGVTRHLLLMTATPHAGKEEDFQLFLTLLDCDRFAGRAERAADTDDLMRRRVKEDLLTFEGRKLFPERIAETVPYNLTELENDLYERVTEYVREGMNRADRIGGKRRNTVGFALTVLQRRLASSPEAIFKSLQRRSRRLERKRQEILAGTYREPKSVLDQLDLNDLDADALNADEMETLENDLLDAATAAQTAAELDAELQELDELIRVAERVRSSGTDKKWAELRTILEQHVLTPDPRGLPRKLIIFTEHRDTLDYLTQRIRVLIGGAAAVQFIHGGVDRLERRRITEEFAKNPQCRFLIATDAAGEGLNLHAAHLMVNYDLPWNPNRIEQRFGRIHRIGQEEVCRLWNLVAENTREGEVWVRLLQKIQEQSRAYGGKVFDVLGDVFVETPLRSLLMRAIQYGEREDVRAQMHEVIDRNVGEGLRDLLEERALAADRFTASDLDELRASIDSGRRLRPGEIENAFRDAFTRFGGHIVKREKGRYEITSVPPQIRGSNHGPIARRYNRITFDRAYVEPHGLARADLMGPGHPLHDAVMEAAIDHYAGALNRGTVLVSPSLAATHLLVGVKEEVVDATGAVLARRFGYAYVDGDGTVIETDSAPYLDLAEAPPDTPVGEVVRQVPWLVDAEERATTWIINNRLPKYLEETQKRRESELAKARQQIVERLEGERDRHLREAQAAALKEKLGEKARESSESLNRKAVELDHRLQDRLDHLGKQAHMTTKPPEIVIAALVLPAAMSNRPGCAEPRNMAL